MGNDRTLKYRTNAEEAFRQERAKRQAETANQPQSRTEAAPAKNFESTRKLPPIVYFPDRFRRLTQEIYQAYLSKNSDQIAAIKNKIKADENNVGIPDSVIHDALLPAVYSSIFRCGYKLYGKKWQQVRNYLVSLDIPIPRGEITEQVQWALTNALVEHINEQFRIR
jgi:hypothetical protein